MKHSKRLRKDGKLVSISSLPIAIIYIYIFTHITLLVALIKYLVIVIKDFFLLQFFVKWGWKKIPITNVDHKLDQEVPFEPSLAPIYLNFIYFWGRPLALLVLRLKHTSKKYIIEYFNLIGILYKTAADFYSYNMTTTHRPTKKDYRDKNFDTIRSLDPHYLCVPSLHVAIVILCFTFFTDVFEKEAFSEEEKDFYSKELYAGAIQIAETVLYVKQHSVNCIPAAIYLMTKTSKNLFTIDKAIQFIDDLFKDQSNISPEAKKAINEHIHFHFEEFLLAGQFEEDWTIPLKHWLANYTQNETTKL